MRELCRRLVEEAMALGADAADAICVERTGVEADVYGGEVDSFVKSLSRGAGIRTIVDGRVGYAYTEKPDEIQSVVQAALDSARISDVQSGAAIYSGKGATGCLEPKALDKAGDVTKTALKLYETVMAQGAHSVQACTAETARTAVYFANSAGIACEDCQKFAAIFAEPVAKKDGFTDSNYDFHVAASIEDLDIKKVAEESMRRAMQYYGAKPVKGGEVPVVVSAEAMADILGAFAPAFSAENAQKGLSLLKGKEGTKVAEDIITLVDSPKHPQLPLNYAFDGEGVPTTEKNVIDQGVLTTLLYDMASANRQNISSTGNARRGYNTSVTIAPYHFYIKRGGTALDELLREARDGVIVQEVSGLHAGVNATSGDFSLLAKGFALKNGQKGVPIEQMVVSGNFFILLKNVRLLGDDLTFRIPAGSCFGSPSLLADGLTIACE